MTGSICCMHIASPESKDTLDTQHTCVIPDILEWAYTSGCCHTGDGDCGYRATAVGLVLALHALPNAEATSKAFLSRIAQLYGNIPEDMLSAQHAAQRAAQSSGSAYDGAVFFQVGLCCRF